ncbi:MAG: alpha/beta hydrolase [Ardenticatenaceae bacterium]|nr:alpha/beta hydrolase [Ardenticatenaceae bacterium]
MDLLPGVQSHTTKTDRLTMHYLTYGPEDGIPVILVHGNLSTGRFYEHLMPNAPAGYRFIMPDMRGFGDTERVPIDATRGLRDWADDTHSLVQALGITQPVHLAGWSTGGAAVAAYTMDRPQEVTSLTFIDPVSPFGFGGTMPDGTPCYPDWAGSGGGTGNPDFTQRLAEGDKSTDSPFSPRNVINTSYWSPNYQCPPERLDMLVDEVLKSVTGIDGYPGDFTTSENWPGIAPGTRGILNALSGKYCNWAGIVNIDPKPPVLWTHGTADIVVADSSAWDFATLGQMELIPGWPGADVFPQQPMVTQIRNVLEQYAAAGGRVRMEMFEGSGHGPVFDAAERWAGMFFGFLQASS